MLNKPGKKFFSLGEKKELVWRHPVLIIVLSLIILLNLMIVLTVPSIPKASGTGLESWVLRGIALLALMNVIFMFAIIYWKKWGFYGYLTVSIFTFMINVYFSHHILTPLLGFGGPVMLWGALMLGKERRGWKQLR